MAAGVPFLTAFPVVRGRLTKDPRHAHVMLHWDGRDLLGEVTDVDYDGRFYRLKVRHFNGEPWPLEPVASVVRVLERQYGSATEGRHWGSGWGKYVGREFKSWSLKHHGPAVYRAESYDDSHGFWMVNVDDPTDRRDVSERAIGRTYHEIPKRSGARRA